MRVDLPAVTLRPVAGDLFTLRAVKHPLEITLIEAACRVNTAALDAALAAAARRRSTPDPVELASALLALAVALGTLLDGSREALDARLVAWLEDTGAA